MRNGKLEPKNRMLPPPHPSIPYLCTNVGRPHIQRSVLEPWHPSLVKSNQILDTLQEDLFIKFLMLQQCYHTSLPNKKFTTYYILSTIYLHSTLVSIVTGGYYFPSQFCLYKRWVLTVIFLRATREIVAHNSLSIYF